MLFKGSWKIPDLKKVKKNGLTVFSCFHCGGGSSFGYKMSGFEVLGGVEIDKKMSKVYVSNHKPKHEYLMSIDNFNEIPSKDLPRDLFDLDVLDGSPPCSSFSMIGNRESDWGKKKKFKEGQVEQVLDDLFFSFVKTADKLRPKVIIAENVTGMMRGDAIGYVDEVVNKINEIGYSVQLFELDASQMGVPQYRRRLFFIARRNDLKLNKINLEFHEKRISFSTINENNAPSNYRDIPRSILKRFEKIPPGRLYCYGYPKRTFFGYAKVHNNRPIQTVTASHTLTHCKYKRFLSDNELIAAQTFPTDYNFTGTKVIYICGMSVPPFMMNRLSAEVAKQFFGK